MAELEKKEKEVLIYFDERKYEESVHRVENLHTDIPLLENDLKTLFDIDLTPKVFIDIINNNGKDSLRKITRDFNSDLKVLKGVKMKETLGLHFEESKEQLKDIVLKYSHLKELLKHATLKEGLEVVFKTGYKDVLRHDAGQYLTDSKELALYHQQNKVIAELKALRGLIHESNSNLRLIPVSLLNLLCCDGEFNYKPLNYGLLVNGAGFSPLFKPLAK